MKRKQENSQQETAQQMSFFSMENDEQTASQKAENENLKNKNDKQSPSQNLEETLENIEEKPEISEGTLQKSEQEPEKQEKMQEDKTEKASAGDGEASEVVSHEISAEHLEGGIIKQNKGFLSKFKKLYRSKSEKRLQEMQNMSTEEKKVVEEKIEVSSKEVKEYKSSTKKKKLKNAFFLVFNLVLVAAILLWNVLSTEDFSPLTFFDLHLEFLVYALLLLAAILILDTMTVHRMIYRKTVRSRWCLSYKSVALVRYYDAVTPLASGGQAFMVTYLTGRDVPGATALSIPITKLLFQNISWLVVTGVCLIISLSSGMGAFVSTTSIIGFGLAFLLVAFILFVSLSKKAGKKLVSWCISLLVKMHILKDYDKYYKKTISFVEDYQNVMKEYNRSKIDVVYQFILHILRFVALFSIPFFIYCAFKGWSPELYGEFFIYTALIDLASSFIPLPGGTGMNEITFTYLFKQYLGGATFWALLFWRFCSYYFYLLQGLVVQTYDTLHGNRKYRWEKTKYNLQAESREFKRAQIDAFRKERTKRRRGSK